MPTVDFTRYYRYAEMTEALQAFVEAYPSLAQLESIGKSHEGRDIWCITITNTATGSADQKPAYWLDGNLHASENTGCMGALHVVQTLLNGYNERADLTRLLDTSAFYIVPCVNPDGMEQVLSSPYTLRSGTRPYPYLDEFDGLYPHDIDGDGMVLEMRVKDPDGAWKVSDKDPRLMVQRKPDEFGGTYYRIFTEGLIRNYDGEIVKVAPPVQGLDFNRNFPYSWAPEGEELGAGPYALSEPETHALVKFVSEHPNISGSISYHTYSGAILRPYSDRPDDAMAIDDVWTYQAIGARGQELTGYPHISVYHEFRYHPRKVMHGSFDGWAYENQGIFAFVVELWDLIGEAGIKDRDFIGWMRNHPEEDDLKILQWNDEHLNGEGFVNWRPFQHPQLGEVEIGGWIDQYTMNNPPHKFLLKCLEPNTEFVIAHAAMLPRLELRKLVAEQISEGVYRVQANLANSGYLPTYTSRRAQAIKAVRPIIVTLDLPEGASLVSGELKQEIGHLEGRANNESLWTRSASVSNVRKLEWVVRVPAGSSINLTAVAQRAGTVSGSVVAE